MNRRHFLLALAALGLAPKSGPLQASTLRPARIGAAWRGPKPDDPYHAGALVADWNQSKVAIAYSLRLPGRPHGLLAEADGGLVVFGVRPGAWLLRCDGEGRLVQRIDMATEGVCRLNGHGVIGAGGSLLYTTETHQETGRGRIGVRERASLKKVDEWDSHGIDPHQLTIDPAGRLIVANGGVPRTPADKKYDLHRMDPSLVRLDPAGGALAGQWRLPDPRLSLRHLAWNRGAEGAALLGIALQAEHEVAEQRTAAPTLALFDGEHLALPTASNDGHGFAGDIAAAANGFVLSSNKAGLAQLWHPTAPGSLASIVKFTETYALASWGGPAGGALIATAYGLVGWDPREPAAFLAWPEPMALDNHWVPLEAS